MKLLAIDTSSMLASVSTFNEEIILNFEDTNNVTHSERLLKLIDTALMNSNLTLNSLDYLMTTNGPGSFTGARIGAVTIKGLALPTNKKIIAVSSIETVAISAYLALHTSEEKNICVILDAKNNRAYYGLFKIHKNTDGKLLYSTLIDISNETLDEIFDKLNSYNDITISSNIYEKISTDYYSANFFFIKETLEPHSSQLINYFINVDKSIIDSHVKDTYTLDITYARASQAERIKNGEKN